CGERVGDADQNEERIDRKRARELEPNEQRRAKQQRNDGRAAPHTPQKLVSQGVHFSFQLPAPSSQLPAPSSQLPASSSQLPAPSSQLPAPRSQPPAPSSQLPAPSSQLPARSWKPEAGGS